MKDISQAYSLSSAEALLDRDSALGKVCVGVARSSSSTLAVTCTRFQLDGVPARFEVSV